MRLGEAGVDLSGIEILDGRFVILAFGEIFFAAIEVFLFANIRVVGTAVTLRREKAKPAAGGRRQGGSSSGSPKRDGPGTRRAPAQSMILHHKPGKQLRGVIIIDHPSPNKYIDLQRGCKCRAGEEHRDEGQNALLGGVGALPGNMGVVIRTIDPSLRFIRMESLTR